MDTHRLGRDGGELPSQEEEGRGPVGQGQLTPDTGLDPSADRASDASHRVGGQEK